MVRGRRKDVPLYVFLESHRVTRVSSAGNNAPWQVIGLVIKFLSGKKGLFLCSVNIPICGETCKRRYRRIA